MRTTAGSQNGQTSRVEAELMKARLIREKANVRPVRKTVKSSAYVPAHTCVGDEVEISARASAGGDACPRGLRGRTPVVRISQ